MVFKVLELSLTISMFVLAIKLPAFCAVLSVKDYMDMIVKDNRELKSVHLRIDSVRKKLFQAEKKHAYFLRTGISYIDARNETGCNFSKIAICNTNIDKFFRTGTCISLGFKYNGNNKKT
ncbi:MAG: hypothetical protein LBS15_03450 [Endomicrobium sp.]|nr:hypothetical protein [Endomicrobium sp.]